MDSSRVNYLEKTGRWGKCGKNNKNANDLRPARDDKGIKALKQKGGVFMRCETGSKCVIYPLPSSPSACDRAQRANMQVERGGVE